MSTSRVTALGASLVWRVLKTRWPVRAARMAISAVSRSADLPHHDHVGVLAHDVAQAGGKGQPDLGVDVDLVDPVHLVLTGSSMVMIFLSGWLIRFMAL